MSNRGLEDYGRVQQFIDFECLKLTNEKMPKRENILIESGSIHTKIGSGSLEYRTVYGRKLYYHPEYNFNEAPERGGYAFDRVKQQYKERILSGAQKLANGD